MGRVGSPVRVLRWMFMERKNDIHSRSDGSVCGGGTTDISCVFSYS